MVSSVKKIEQDFVKFESNFDKFLQKYEKENDNIWEQLDENKVEIAKLNSL